MLKRIRELLGRRGTETSSEPPDATNDGTPSNDVRTDGSGPASVAPVIHVGPRAVHQPISEDRLDLDAVKIVRRLARFDHIAYLVGGCVRDLLLDRTPKDFDIATSATPRQVKRAFRNCRIIGKRFRLAHIYFQNGKIIEVATFRAQDEDDSSGERNDDDVMIRDDNVFGTPEEDALRRDFTMNQLFYDLGTETILDHAGGLDDLRRRVVRTIGDAELRFREDPVRILRAIKFAARLDFEIERNTLEAVTRNRAEIPRAAPPRVLEEIYRFARSGVAVRSFELQRETAIFDVLFPELGPMYADGDARWLLLLTLLERFDRRVADGADVASGEVLAALLLPVVADEIGWNADEGRATRPRGLDVRRTIDASLRPIAVRLRVARRDQEHARQLIALLHRMVPARRVRANTRRALISRDVFPEALAWLEILGERFGDEFREAHVYWARAAEATTAEPKPESQDARDDSTPDRPRRRRRRRGRGKGSRATGQKSTDAAGAPPESAPGSDAGTRGRRATPDLPPVWDDRYFFAALPTVPDGQDASKPTSSGDAPGEGRTTVESDSPAPSGRRRRRRRRGRSRSGTATEGSVDRNDGEAS